MALANFFDKAALSASQILAGVSREEFARRVEATQVAVVFGDDGANSHEGRVSAELAVNLLARLYPAITLLPEGDAARAYAATLEALGKAINPNLEFDRQTDPTIVLQVGTAAGVAAPVRLFVGSENWTARLSTKAALTCGNSAVPFGAAAATALGCANIFRSVFADLLGNPPLDANVILSLLDYDLDAQAPVLAPPDLGSVFLAGAGAVGNAMLWTLSRFPGIAGNMTVVDPEAVELSNLQRYILTTQSSIAQPKVLLAADSFGGSGLTIVPQQVTWGTFLAARDDYRLDMVLVALDTAQDRITAQGVLPRRMVNAWTQQHNLGISRHELFGSQACLACLYFPEGTSPDMDDLIGEAIRMTSDQEKLQLRQLLHSGAGLSPEFMATIADRTGVPLAELQAFVGKPLRSLYSGAVCGGILLKHGAGNASVAEVPMAFQSALAGIMLAAELCAPRTAPTPTTTTLNVLKPLEGYYSFACQCHPQCYCADPAYQAAWNSKWT